ncbi:hypothetical protein ACQVP2_07450 [Methylobacterium aquaticum]|uniref:hypothetical protein n=1 Tax=Methylobacterium aquaticum TaxID=270351 RepID=UPI003D169705
MADITMVDLTDPCAAAAALRTAYFALVSGQQEQRIRFKNGDVDEDVWFTPTKLDLLRTELSRQESLCAAKTTGRTQRFCFTAG